MPSQQFFDLLNALNSLERNDKYSAFQVINVPYKPSPDGNGHIAADILVPKTLADARPSRSCPIIIRIHGEFLVSVLPKSHVSDIADQPAGNRIKPLCTVVQRLDSGLRHRKPGRCHIPRL